MLMLPAVNKIKVIPKLQNNIITDEQFKEICRLIIIKENNKKTYLEELKSIQKQTLDLTETELNTDIEDYMNFII